MPSRAVFLAFTAGLYFALAQLGYFRQLEFDWSSTYVAYFSTVGLWLVGSLIGLCLTRRDLELPLLALGLAAYHGTWLTISTHPFDSRFLPLYWLAIATTALYTGYFFRHARAAFASPRLLFFHENNGFLVGYALGGTVLLLYGHTEALLLPLGAALLHLIVKIVRYRR